MDFRVCHSFAVVKTLHAVFEPSEAHPLLRAEATRHGPRVVVLDSGSHPEQSATLVPEAPPRVGSDASVSV